MRSLYPYLNLFFPRAVGAATIAIALLAGTAQAQFTTYDIEYHVTQSTDSTVKINLHGESGGWTGWLNIKGDKEDGLGIRDTYAAQNVGAVTYISVDVMNDNFWDDWTPTWIKVYSPDGTMAKFVVGKNLTAGGDQTTFTATEIKRPAVTVLPTGKVQTNSETVTLAHFGWNDSSIQQVGMQYTEKWENVKAIEVSTTKVTGSEVGMTVGYTSPESVAGQFSAQASASWKDELATARSESEANLTGSEYKWDFQLAPFSGMFRRATFNIPLEYALYKEGANGEKRWVKTVGAKFAPTGTPQFLEIPYRPSGKLTPYSWSKIQSDYWPYMNDQARAAVTMRKSEWLAKGWVYEGNQAPFLMTPVTNLKASPGPADKAVTLTWTIDSSTDLMGFEAWMSSNGNSGWSKLGDVNPIQGMSYSVKMLNNGLLPGKKMYFRLRARSTSGAYSKYSNTAVALFEAAPAITDLGPVTGDPGTPSGGNSLTPTTPDNTNNGGSSSTSGSTATKAPDLVGTFEKANFDGNRLNVSFMVRNSGDIASESFTVRAFITKNKQVEVKKDIRVGFKNVPGLAPGQSMKVVIREPINEARLQGMKVVVVLDTAGTVAESNEGNNQIISNKTFGKGMAEKKKKAEKKSKKGTKKKGKNGKGGKSNKN